MTSSSKSKTLRVERLENRELMASYVGFVEAAELEDMNLLSEKMAGKEGANWARPMRTELNTEIDRGSFSPHMLPRELKGSVAPNAMMERNNRGSGWMIHVPIVQEVVILVSVRPNGSDKGTQNSVSSSSNTSQTIDRNWADTVGESVADVGEGEEPIRFMDPPMRSEGNSSPPSTREAPQPNVRRAGIAFDGDATTNIVDEKGDTESESSFSVHSNANHEAVEEVRGEVPTREDEYFTQLGGAMKSETQEFALEDAYLDLFVFSDERSTDFQFEDRLRIRQGRNVDMTWDYLVATTYGEETNSVEATPVKHNSLFDVYDPARSAANVEALRYDSTKFSKDLMEQGNESTDEEVSLIDSRYWALGLGIASAWLGMQQRKSRSSKWLMGLNFFARDSMYSKKDSDRR